MDESKADSKFDNWFMVYLYNIQRQTFFDNFIVICILANTAAMSIDQYPSLSNNIGE